MKKLLDIIYAILYMFHETKQRDISAELEAEARQAVREHSAKMAVK